MPPSDKKLPSAKLTAHNRAMAAQYLRLRALGDHTQAGPAAALKHYILSRADLAKSLLQKGR